MVSVNLRNGEKWFRRKKMRAALEGLIVRLRGPADLESRNEEKRFRAKTVRRRPRGRAFWLLRRRSELKGNEENWFRQETVQQLCGPCPLSSPVPA